MSNPYDKPNLTGYNQNPPPDDGTQSSSNLLTWAKHLTKIGNPLRDFASAISNAVESAFNRIFGNGVQEISTSTTLTGSDQGQVIYATGGPVTLPSTTDVGSNWIVVIVNDNARNAGNEITIEGNGSQTVEGESSIELQGQTFGFFISDGTNFRAFVSEQDALKDPVHTTSSAVGFDTWTTPNANRATMVVVQATAETDSSTDANIDFEVDYSGGTSPDDSFRFVSMVADAHSNTTRTTGSFTIIVPAGASYQVANTNDPNSGNSVDEVAEYEL